MEIEKKEILKRIEKKEEENPIDRMECFDLDDDGRSVLVKVVILCVYLLFTTVIAIIIDPFLHEFGHLLFSGLDGYIGFDFSSITDVRIFAVPNTIYFWTYAGGVTMEYLFSMACSVFSMFKKSVLFSVLASVSFVFPTIYGVSYLFGYVPAGCDFIWFETIHWVVYWVMLAVAMTLLITMIVITLTHAVKSVKRERMVCVF